MYKRQSTTNAAFRPLRQGPDQKNTQTPAQRLARRFPPCHPRTDAGRCSQRTLRADDGQAEQGTVFHRRAAIDTGIYGLDKRRSP